MNMSNLAEIGVSLLRTVVGLYVSILMLRFFLTLTQADYYNPVSRFVVTCTRAPVALLRRFAPVHRHVDTAVLVLLFALQLASSWAVFALLGQSVNFGLLALWALSELLKSMFSLFWFSILLSALLSWVGPVGMTPLRSVLYSLTEPLLRPVRAVVPTISGVDLSPLIVLIGLEALKRLALDVLTTAMAGFIG